VANVICRAELPGSPTREQYEQFHTGMKELGLERTITRDGKVFHLPTGEYLGVNLSTLMMTLDLKITVLAFRVTGGRCKLALTPVADVSTIHISGLEEDTSHEVNWFENLLSAPPPEPNNFAWFTSLLSTPPPEPNNSDFWATLALADSKNTPPQPTGISVSSLFGSFPGSKS
jgi:hypothetical protein